MTQKLDVGVFENSQGKRRVGTKAKAILAGGLVLGVGAAITLAAWTDTEWATGVFGAGTFGIEGSIDGGANYEEHATKPGAADVDFTLAASKLAPGDSVYGSFAVRLIQTSTNQASVAVTQDDASKLAGTTVSYKYTATAECDAAAYTAGTNENGASFDLTALATPVYLCFKVTADSSLAQGQTGSYTWSFAATSTAAL